MWQMQDCFKVYLFVKKREKEKKKWFVRQGKRKFILICTGISPFAQWSVCTIQTVLIITVIKY